MIGSLSPLATPPIRSPCLACPPPHVLHIGMLDCRNPARGVEVHGVAHLRSLPLHSPRTPSHPYPRPPYHMYENTFPGTRTETLGVPMCCTTLCVPPLCPTPGVGSSSPAPRGGLQTSEGGALVALGVGYRVWGGALWAHSVGAPLGQAGLERSPQWLATQEVHVTGPGPRGHQPLVGVQSQVGVVVGVGR